MFEGREGDGMGGGRECDARGRGGIEWSLREEEGKKVESKRKRGKPSQGRGREG